MVEEARIEESERGRVVKNDGWFVVNVAEAPWLRSQRFGRGCNFQGDVRFPQIGIYLRVLEPGQPACLYHREDAQEDFLVLSGECLLIVEDEERELRAGDFVHCPPWTAHVFVGAGEGTCTILMIGHRREDGEETLLYPVSEVAAKYGASVEKETPNQAEAYGEISVEIADPVWPCY